MIMKTNTRQGRDDDLYLYALLVSLHHLSVFTPCLHS